MDSNPIHLPSQAKKKWNAHFWITFTFWWSAGLVDGLKPHLPPLSRHKIKCSFLHYVQLVMIGWAGQWTQTPSATPLQPKKWNANFWITFNFWWSDGLVNGLEPHLPPFSNQKNEMAIFGFHSTSDDWPGWSMDSNPICYPSPAKKMKCLFLDYVQLLMICWAGQWIQTPSTTHLQPKKWNAHFWITFNFWWSARLVDGLKLHPPPLSSQRMKCLFLDYVQLLMIGQAGQWTWTPSATPLQPKEWYAHFCIKFKFWWSAKLVDGLEPHLPAFSNQKNEMLVLYYVIVLMISWAGQWTRTLSTTCLQPRNEMLILELRSTLQAGQWTKSTMKCSFLDYVQLLMIGQVGRWTQTPWSAKKNETLVFGLCSTSDDWPGWSMDSNPNPICNLLVQTKKKMKCSFLYYVQKKWNAHFWITFNSYDWPSLVNGLEPHLQPLSTKKMKCSFLVYIQLLMISRAGRWTQTPSVTPLQPKKWNACFCIMFKLLMISRAGRWTRTPPAISSHLFVSRLAGQWNEMLIFGLHLPSDSTSATSLQA